MAIIRIEAFEDPASGRYGLEIYFPSEAQQPLVTTTARYASVAAAENDLIAVIASAANSYDAERAAAQLPPAADVNARSQSGSAVTS